MMTSNTVETEKYVEVDLPEHEHCLLEKVLIPRNARVVAFRGSRSAGTDAQIKVVHTISNKEGNLAKLLSKGSIQKRLWRQIEKNRITENENQRKRHKKQRQSESPSAKAQRLAKRRKWYAKKKKNRKLRDWKVSESSEDSHSSSSGTQSSYDSAYNSLPTNDMSHSTGTESSSVDARDTRNQNSSPSVAQTESELQGGSLSGSGDSFLYEIHENIYSLKVYRHMLVPVNKIPHSNVGVLNISDGNEMNLTSGTDDGTGEDEDQSRNAT